jgi:hypothetical protein
MFSSYLNNPTGDNMFKQLIQRRQQALLNTACSRNVARIGLLPAIALAFLFIAALSIPTRAQAPITLPEATVNRPYGPVQLSFDGPAPSVTWSQSAANPVPIGILLNSSTGVLSGTPTAAGQFEFVLAVTSNTDATVKGEQRFRMKVNPFALRIELATPTPTPTPPALAPVALTPTRAPTPDRKPSNSDELTISVANVFNPTGLIAPGTTDIIDGQQGNLIENLLPGLALEDYCVVQVVRWKQAAGSAGAPAKYEAKDRWYLFQKLTDPDNSAQAIWKLQEKQDGVRIYGSKRVAALLIHLDALESWDIKYAVKVTERIPANIQNVLDLAGVIASKGVARDAAPPTANLWGGQLLTNINDIPSDIAFKGSIKFINPDGSNDQQPTEYAKSYINEGRYHWDVSVGLPVKSFSEVQYEASSGVVSAKKTERQNAYGLLNVFLNPKGVDLSDDAAFSTLHFVAGVPISGKPLDRPMVGLGMGFYKTPIKFNIFAGPVFNRIREPRTLQAGDVATDAALQADLRTRWVTKFIFGINMPVRQFVKALGAK